MKIVQDKNPLGKSPRFRFDEAGIIFDHHGRTTFNHLRHEHVTREFNFEELINLLEYKPKKVKIPSELQEFIEGLQHVDEEQLDKQQLLDIIYKFNNFLIKNFLDDQEIQNEVQDTQELVFSI